MGVCASPNLTPSGPETVPPAVSSGRSRSRQVKSSLNNPQNSKIHVIGPFTPQYMEVTDSSTGSLASARSSFSRPADHSRLFRSKSTSELPDDFSRPQSLTAKLSPVSSVKSFMGVICRKEIFPGDKGSCRSLASPARSPGDGCDGQRPSAVIYAPKNSQLSRNTKVDESLIVSTWVVWAQARIICSTSVWGTSSHPRHKLLCIVLATGSTTRWIPLPLPRLLMPFERSPSAQACREMPARCNRSSRRRATGACQGANAVGAGAKRQSSSECVSSFVR
jgi:hypothetical protein